MKRGLCRTAVAVRYGAILVAAITSALLPGAASAGSLDQSQPDFGSAKGFVGTFNDATGSPVLQSQSFTSGLTGNLDRVDLPVRVVGDPGVALTTQIRTIVGGVPSDVVLASAIVPESALPVFTGPESDFTTFSFQPIVFTSPAAVTAGTTYAIVLLAPGATPTVFTPNRYEWAGVSGDPYPGGTHHSGVGSTWNGDDGVDLAFKTYVASATVQFLQPLDQSTDPANPVRNVGRNGRVIPVKVQIHASDGTDVTNASNPTVAMTISHLTTCTSSTSDAIETYAPAGAANNDGIFRWDGTAWAYNWDTSSSGLITGDCYRINIVLNGTTIANAFAIYQPVR